MTDQCSSCNFSLQDGANLFCRRYPPQAFIGVPSGPMGAPGTISTMPPVKPDMWCGEFAAPPATITADPDVVDGAATDELPWVAGQ